MSRILRLGFLGLAIAMVPLLAPQKSEAGDFRVRVGPVVPYCAPAPAWYGGFTIYRPAYNHHWYAQRHTHANYGHHNHRR